MLSSFLSRGASVARSRCAFRALPSLSHVPSTVCFPCSASPSASTALTMTLDLSRLSLADRSYSSSPPSMSLLDQFRDPISRSTRSKELVGRHWSMRELRRKSYEDLHKLWYVLYKEYNMLITEEQLSSTRGLYFPQPDRKRKVKRGMKAIKHTLGERKLAKLAAVQAKVEERKQERIAEELRRAEINRAKKAEATVKTLVEKQKLAEEMEKKRMESRSRKAAIRRQKFVFKAQQRWDAQNKLKKAQIEDGEKKAEEVVMKDKEEASVEVDKAT